MAVETTIHNTWANTAALTAIVPAARFFTGDAYGLPDDGSFVTYATLDKNSTRPLYRATGGAEVESHSFTLDVVADNLATIKTIWPLIKAAYNRTSWSDAYSTVILWQWDTVTETQDPDKTWILSVDFTVHEIKTQTT